MKIQPVDAELFHAEGWTQLMNVTKKITRTVSQKPTVVRSHTSDCFCYWLSTIVQFSHQE